MKTAVSRGSREFNENAVTLGTGITLAAAKAALEAQNIYLKTPISAADPS